MTGRNTMNYARVADLRHEATGQISGAVVKEAAKQISPENLKPKDYSLGQREVHRATVSRDVGESEWSCRS
jgi:hypothetical protein